ncbi:DUF4476 domain-containing protein [Foetidibacter luteolus]|uniref:DUF4476 domain-containing protein n=1 Tax=Foetidibacter luteolus TaxID=2608880 RepID=UPI00129AAEC2|nr:DUF4476 domain-containing protein [Foetidibacter luteolus]
MKWMTLLRKQLVTTVFSFLMLHVFAQQNHFIYIEAEKNQPFYVILNGKNYSSSAIGYLIIPKLTDGDYQLRLGFPKDEFPEQQFKIKVDKRDDGYALKNFGEKGWGLFNFQTMEVLMAEGLATSKETVKETKPKEEKPKQDAPAAPKNNAFGDMLSDVVDDPNLSKPVPVVTKKQEPAKPVKEEAAAVNNDSVTVTSVPVTTPRDTGDNENTIEAAAENPYDSYDAAKTKGVIKVSEKSTDEGTDIVFIDFNSKSQDTIRLFIPATGIKKADDVAAAVDTVAKETVVASQPLEKPAETKKNTGYQPYTPNEKPFLQFPPSEKDTVTSKKEPAKEVGNPFFNKTSETEQPKKQPAAEPQVKPKTEDAPAVTQNVSSSSSASLVNNDCKKMATDEDLEKWKKKMVSASSDDEMVKVARKLMSGKCVSTSQVKALSGLFLSDEGRYHFFDAAYPFTYDFGQYATLESQLIDSYYKKRFKAILRM